MLCVQQEQLWNGFLDNGVSQQQYHGSSDQHRPKYILCMKKSSHVIEVYYTQLLIWNRQ
jgi:hypothetical protein